MNIMVVDDEPLLRFHMQKLLKEQWDDVDQVIAVGSGFEALSMAQEVTIHTTFMDIKMPGINGIETAKQLRANGYSGHLVFVTAYDEHAIEAFEHEAIDYLLKPVDERRLSECVQRLQRRSQQTIKYELDAEQFNKLIPSSDSSSALQWINASQGDDIHIIKVSDISCFIAEDKYTTVITEQGEYLIKKSIKQLQEELNSNEFWRIHRAVIVQVRKIEKVKKDENNHYYVVLKELKRELPVSRNNAHLFKQM